MKHLGTIKLETERLILRRFKEDDANMMFLNWANDEEVCRHMTWTPHGNIDLTKYLINMWIDEYKNDNSYNWVIELKEENIIIGSISVVSVNENIKEAVIGYCIGKNWWRKGYTSEAFSKVIEFLFLDVGFNRIEAAHSVFNPNSGKVMKKCGLKYEGTLIQKGKNGNGNIVDMCYYGLTRKDYMKEGK